MNYYYNEIEKSFAITNNFKYVHLPKGFVEITKEEYERLQKEYERLQEELNKEVNENVESR